MKNRVLVTGLGNGILGECSPCNYDAYQLIRHPSMLLWIDKIVIPQKILDAITSHSDDQETRIVQLILEFYEQANLVELVNTEDIFDTSTKAILKKAVCSDVVNLTTLNPELSHVQKDKHFVIHYKNLDYCFPKLLSIYGDLYLSKAVGANCLFAPSSLDYCHLKFGLTAQNPVNTHNVLFGVDKVLSTIIPDIHPYPGFLSKSKKCQNCQKYDDCRDEYYKDLENAMRKYLEWREYDEFYALRDCINKVVLAVRDSDNMVTSDDVVQEFELEKKRINSIIHRHLPKIKKFSNLIAAISVPATIIGAANSTSIPITIGAAALSGASVLTSVISDYIEEKYKWVNFTLK